MDYEWLPAGDSQLLAWLKNFQDQCERYSSSLDLSSNELMEIESDYKAFAYMLAQIDAFRTEAQTRIDYKNALRDGPETNAPVAYPSATILAEPPAAVRTGIIPRVVRLVERIKDSKGYTVDIGRELGIEPLAVDRIPRSPEHIVPMLENGMVKLEFAKSVWQGVMIEAQRGDESVWTVLGTVYESPFVDARPSLLTDEAEARRYRLRYVDANGCVGQYSKEVQVIVPAESKASAYVK